MLMECANGQPTLNLLKAKLKAGAISIYLLARNGETESSIASLPIRVRRRMVGLHPARSFPNMKNICIAFVS